MIDVDDTNFKQEVVDSPVPVFIDFYATWCGPCKMSAPVIDRAAQKYAGRVKFVRIDIDKCPKAVSANNVDAYPTMILLNAGNHTMVRSEGFLDDDGLKEFIESGLHTR